MPQIDWDKAAVLLSTRELWTRIRLIEAQHEVRLLGGSSNIEWMNDDRAPEEMFDIDLEILYPRYDQLYSESIRRKQLMPRKILGTLGQFFRNTTWTKIMQSLDGQNPIIFIIVKAPSGYVHDVLVKEGKDFIGLSRKEISDSTIPAPDPIVQRNIDALAPQVRLQSVLAHPEMPKPEIPKPEIKKPEPGIPQIKEEEPVEETIAPVDPPVPMEEPEETLPSDSPGEVDLKPGMGVEFLDGSRTMAGKILEIYEDEGQLLLEVAGGRKKIIEGTQVTALA